MKKHLKSLYLCCVIVVVIGSTYLTVMEPEGLGNLSLLLVVALLFLYPWVTKIKR